MSISRNWSWPGFVDGELLSVQSFTFRASGSRFAPARGGATDGLGEAPALPVRGAAGRRPQSGAGDIDLEDLAGMRDDEIADPLGEGGTAPGHGMVA